MQLDRTEIVIKQRVGLELFDLSLRLLNQHLWPIIVTSSLLGLPLLVLNGLALWWMLGEDAFLAAEHLSSPREAMWWRHTSHVVVMFVLQFQLISLPTTIFLGNVIFYETMTAGKLMRRLLPIAVRVLFVLGILRLGLVNLILVWFIDRNVVWDPFTEVWMLIIIPGIAVLLRAAWPFAPEILGLEFCKLRKGKGGDLSYWQRSRGLHYSLASENLGRFIMAACFSGLLTLMLIGTILTAQGLITGYWFWNAWFDHLILPLSLWIVGWFMSVFRFLAYLDSRIRLEGWEMELQMRAEAVRLMHVARPTTGQLPAVTENVGGAESAAMTENAPA